VVSVKLMAPKPYYRGEGPAPLTLQSFNVERMPEGAYRAPTAEELEAFKAATLERKAEAKASRRAAPALVNPTDADAERLQALWNATAKAKYDEKKHYGSEFKPAEVLRMTQAEYSERSKGDYAWCETRTLHATGKSARRFSNCWTAEGQAYDKALGATVAKIRIREGGDWYTPARVIILTDKPQKALPLDWAVIADGTAGTSSAPAPVQAEAVAV
jgi:hypothetical protein